MRYYPNDVKDLHIKLSQEIALRELEVSFDPYKNLDVDFAEMELLKDIVDDLEFLIRVYKN